MTVKELLAYKGGEKAYEILYNEKRSGEVTLWPYMTLSKDMPQEPEKKEPTEENKDED